MSNLYENIPAMLKERRSWVVWGVSGSPQKAPFNPSSLLSGKPLMSKAGIPESWSSYQNAAECVRRGLAQGIGYQFDGGDGIYGVDLDHVIDEAGRLTPQAQEIIDSLDSYTEISPSGTGVHIFVEAPGADITRHRKKDGFVEIYNEARYFTVTGNVIGSSKSIEARPAELQAIHDKYLPSTQEQKSFALPQSTSGLSDYEQEDFLNTGLKRDKVFAQLWEGVRTHGNESSDDIALMNKLAYWCNADPGAMIRAFVSSPYCAQKDNAQRKKCMRTDYLPRTAMAAVTSVRSTAAADRERWLASRNTRKPRKEQAR